MLPCAVPQLVSNSQVKSFGRTFHFDSSKTSAGLTIADDGQTVEHIAPTTNIHKVSVLSKGFNSGSIYCQFRILNDGPNGNIMIGVTDESQPNMVTTSFYPGQGVDKGVSYYGNNGNIYFSATKEVFGPTFINGDTIGILMNCDLGTVSFFKNGVMVGIALRSNVFRIGATYYPAIALCEINAAVELCTFDVLENLTCNELLRSSVPGITRLLSNLRVMSGGEEGDFIFDPCKVAAGLQIDDNDGMTVEQTNIVDSFKVCLLSQGFISGIIYFQFKVLFAGPVHNIKIGVVEGSQPDMLTSSFYPGLDLDRGVSYCSSGARCCSNATTATYFPAYTTGDTVGVLMNCEAGTVTFFKNGIPVGAALGPDVFRAGATSYPAVALNGLGQKVAISTFEVAISTFEIGHYSTF